jgi:hypothetical protein
MAGASDTLGSPWPPLSTRHAQVDRNEAIRFTGEVKMKRIVPTTVSKEIRICNQLSVFEGSHPFTRLIVQVRVVTQRTSRVLEDLGKALELL